ncbi:transglycosylase SLT domain-containing protein [Mitsuokella jalaludinii]|uniref:lytic transglycosylase domain-containing protein n=1 Tax=Mitsuokella jalaludinii TaxID=187979 RepID=UPI001D02B10D|nr:transglycosylase SLT domain-containing protein [Mitsuokella jalaludinii]MCB5723740.1 transglycosylase SLT domain-containing protein [Mitsuokella jalaludinii]
MKFSSYQPVVNPNTINPPAVQAPKDMEVYGTGGKEWTALAGAVGQATKVLAQKQDDEDAADVMDARNRIMTSLNEQLYGEQGLMTLGVGKNAKGLTDRVTQAIQDTSAEIAKDYNPRVRYALKSTLNDNMLNYQRIATGQENRERESTEQADYQAALNINTQNAGMTWDVTNALTNYENDTRRIILAYGAKRGWTGEQIQSELMGAITKQVASAATAAITAGNYDRAAQILQVNRGKMDQNVYNQLYGSVKQKQDVAKTYTTADDIVNQCWDPTTGRFDWNKANELIKQNSYRNVGGQGTGTSSKESFFAAIEGQESGGDSTAVSPAGAVGIYQIMPDNWPSWSKEAGYEGADPNDEAAQRAVGKYKLGQYYDKYGPAGAMVAWYAGEENAKRYVKGETTDIWGRPWDAPQSNGPSIQGYVDSVMSKLPAGEQNAGGGSGGIDISKKVYYTVKPGKEGEVTNLGHSTWAKLNALAALYEQAFGQQNDYEPFYVTAGGSTKGHNPGSKHYENRAFDIAMDSLARHPERLQWLQEHAADVGLKPLNEYAGYGNEQWADGDNFHFSDDGGDFDENAYMGGSTGTAASGETIYDPTMEKSLRSAVEAALQDRTQAYKQDKQNHFDDVEHAVDTAGSFSAAKALVEGDTTLDLQQKNTLIGMAASKFGVNRNTGLPTGSRSSGRKSSSTSVVGTSGAKYTVKEINNARYEVEEYYERMDDPNDTISRTDQRRYNKAANLLQDIGETGSGDNLASSDALEMARHAVEVTADDEEAAWYLISNYGYSEEEADYYIKQAHSD